MHSVILLLPKSLLHHLPALAQVLGLNDILLSVALGPDAGSATHAAGHVWHAHPIVTALDDDALEWAESGLAADVVDTLIEQARLKVTEPGTPTPPHMQFQALLDELGLVRVAG